MLPRIVHVTGIGKPVCSSLAIQLLSKGCRVTGSDESFSEFSSKQLHTAGIMPEQPGWFKEKIQPNIEAVVICQGVNAENPEVQQAKALDIPIYFYTRLVYEFARDKQRIVITGNRGRASLTALLIYVLQYFNRPIDYLIETPVPWLNDYVSLSDAPVIVIEGLDIPEPGTGRAGFLHYQHHMAAITNINWESPAHYASENEYVAQFDALADSTPKAGMLFYNENDTLASVIGAKHRNDVTSVPYRIHPHTSESGKHYVLNGPDRVPVKVYGTQNFESISAAKEILKRTGIPADKFYEALTHFTL